MQVQYIRAIGGVGRADVPGYHPSTLTGTVAGTQDPVGLRWDTGRGMWVEETRPGTGEPEPGVPTQTARPSECVMTHTDPYDFAECHTHDETFPLGQVCRFDGKDIAEVFADEADEQRQLKVRAELDLEYALEDLREARRALAGRGATGPGEDLGACDCACAGSDWPDALRELVTTMPPHVRARLVPGWDQLVLAVRPTLPVTAGKARAFLASAGLAVVGSAGGIIFAGGNQQAWLRLCDRARVAPVAAAAIRWVGPNAGVTVPLEQSVAAEDQRALEDASGGPASAGSAERDLGWSLCLHPVSLPDGLAVNATQAQPLTVLTFLESFVTARGGHFGKPRPSGGLTWVPIRLDDVAALRYIARLLVVRSLRREARISVR